MTFFEIFCGLNIEKMWIHTWIQHWIQVCIQNRVSKITKIIFEFRGVSRADRSRRFANSIPIYRIASNPEIGPQILAQLPKFKFISGDHPKNKFESG